MATPTQNATPVEAVTVSGNSNFTSLVAGTRWVGESGVLLSYSFPGSASNWSTGYSQLNEPGGVMPLGPIEIDAARAVLDIWSRYARVSFTETTETSSNVGEIRFAYTSVDEPTSAAHAYTPGNAPAAGDVWLDVADDFRGFEPGSFDFFTLLHEIGHALGLKHPFEPSSLNDVTISPDADFIGNSIMSYTVHPDFRGTNFGINYLPTTPMPFDIVALRALYGPAEFNTGDNQYIYNEDRDYFETIFDTGGNDTIVWNSEEQFAIIDLVGGNWSSLGNPLFILNRFGDIVETEIYNVAIFRDTVIENVISGNSDDDIYGNEVNNRLEAGGGHDIVWGDAGADTLLGGSGNDHLYGQSPFGGTDGTDSISGGDGSDYLQGNAGADILDGGDGSDRINGGASDDSIAGMAGNDSVNGNLGADTISGGDGNDSLRGGQGNDSISGGIGNDMVSGDLGADILSGGEGVDVFIFGGTASPVGQPDRITDFQIGIDRLAVGFAPSAILTDIARSSAQAAADAAQLLFAGRDGNGEVAVLAVGTDTYVFFGAGGGGTVDMAVVLAGINASLTTGDFA